VDTFNELEAYLYCMRHHSPKPPLLKVRPIHKFFIFDHFVHDPRLLVREILGVSLRVPPPVDELDEPNKETRAQNEC
jgi:hypothetical protein